MSDEGAGNVFKKEVIGTFMPCCRKLLFPPSIVASSSQFKNIVCVPLQYADRNFLSLSSEQSCLHHIYSIVILFYAKRAKVMNKCVGSPEKK